MRRSNYSAIAKGLRSCSGRTRCRELACTKTLATARSRRFPILFAVPTLLLMLAGCSVSPSLPSSSVVDGPMLPERPNILWLVAEDLSPIIPPFGDNTVETPTLSWLASEGVRYSHVFSPSGVCAPSRAAIATGMYQNHIGAQHMRTTSVAGFGVEGLIPYEAVPPSYVKMLSQYFREAGYYASNRAKEDYQFNRAVTAWDDSSNTAHWRNRAPGQPFFAVFNFGITHESQIWGQADNPLLVDADLAVPVPPYLPDTEVALGDIRRVYSNVVAMDRQVGEVLAELEEDGLLDNTIIFWYSDHGGPLPRQKRLLYDAGMRLPLIIRYPDRWRAGEVDDQLISFVDFLSTSLSLAGLEPPAYVDGRAFIGDYVNTPPRRYVHGAADRFDTEYDTIRAVRDSRFKYLRNFQPDKPYYLPLTYREQMPIMQELLRLRDAGELTPAQAQWFRSSKSAEELFDTTQDPHELNNLAGDSRYGEKLAELRAELQRWMTAIDDKGLMAERELIATMWPGMIQPVTAAPVISREGNLISLSSETDGANLGYQILTGAEQAAPTWLVYQQPVELQPGQRLVAVAHRLGYRPSDTVIVQD